MNSIKTLFGATTDKEKQKQASNCYQWVSDLYSLFIEHEDEQRVLTLKKGKTMVLHSDTDKAKALRGFVKQFGFTCHGLDYQHVADVCEGRATTLHFVLTCNPEKVKAYLDAKPSLIKSIKNITVAGTRMFFAGTVWYNEGFGLGTIPLLGLAALTSYVYSTTKGYNNQELLEQLNKQLEIFRNDFAEALALEKDILKIKSIPSETNELDLHVTINADELKEDKTGEQGDTVGTLFPQTNRQAHDHSSQYLLKF